jgi:hypothetical protein
MALDEFSPDARTRDGKQSRCKACQRELRKEWRETNPELAKAERGAFLAANPGYFREHYSRNKSRESERKAKAYRADPAVRERLQRYAEANPHVRTGITAKRRASLLQAIPSWADHAAIQSLYALAKRLTDESGAIHEVDHIVPLQGGTVCGLHCEANLGVLPRSENRSKSNRSWPGKP